MNADKSDERSRADLEILKLLHGSAEQGNTGSQFNLGLLHDKALLGSDKDPAEAEKWYRQAAAGFQKAAESGDADAQCQLAGCIPVGKASHKVFQRRNRGIVKPPCKVMPEANSSLD